MIGASKGGLHALRDLLGQLPSDLCAAVFVTMHIGNHDSALASILAKNTALKVSFAVHEEPIRNGHVYVAPPDRHLLVDRGSIRLSRSAKENHARPAIDPMFRSAAIAYKSRAVGIILTGQLDDGIVGLQAVKVYGGTALVQDPKTAEAPSMPENAIRYVDVDACLSLQELAVRLTKLTQDTLTADTASPEPICIEPFATENDLTYDMSAGSAKALDAIGTISGMSCPECGGALWELGYHPLRYRCHTGHSYTAAALIEAQNETIEGALWVSIRALHEKQLLLAQRALVSKNAGAHQVAEEYELANKELESHKDALRTLVRSLHPI